MSKDLFANYKPNGFFCELFGGDDKLPPHSRVLVNRLSKMKLSTLRRRAKAIEAELFNLGITFTVYSDKDRIDRILPFDVIPRLISAKEWEHLDAGCVQRVTALNLFIHDVYHDQKIFRDKIYVVENRHLMRRAFPDLMEKLNVLPVSDYGSRLRAMLNQVSPAGVRSPRVVLLSPGVFNSAYFEHVFLAREMGAPLVEGRDLVVQDNHVFMRTTNGLSQVDVIYRRIDDAFLDPKAFNPESMLGVPHLMKAYLAGNVNIANAVGTGFADDKAVYAYMPAIIKYYLDQDPILPNVETYTCHDKKMLEYTLANLESLVVKPVGESGGYGVVVGPRASRAELQELRRKLKAKPANFISQPLIQLSVCPTVCEGGVEPRHVDLRPYVLTGKSSWVLPGGLSRVALRKGSYIVNSSQGGGTKDTWVIG